MNRIVVFAALVCAVSPLSAHRVRVDFDHGTHFTKYKTYSWVAAPNPPPDGGSFPNQLMQQRVAGFIEEALAARGYKRVEKGGDLLISYGIQVSETPQFTTFSDGPGWGWGWGSGFSTTTVQTIYEGTLVVDMVDAHHNKLVFQGTSSQTISSRPATNTRKLAKAVNEIFERYPPQP